MVCQTGLVRVIIINMTVMGMVNGQGGSMDTRRGTRFEICDNKITRFHSYYFSL